MMDEVNSGVMRNSTSTHHWVAVWTAMPQPTEPDNMPPSPYNEPDLAFSNATLRQTLRISTGGQQLRFKISNAFGVEDLPITAATVAMPQGEAVKCGSKMILTESIQILNFDGKQAVNIPTGAHAVSDPVKFPVLSGEVISLNIFLRHGQSGGQITSHPGSRTQTWISPGDSTRMEDMNHSMTRSTFHWYFISGVEIWQPRQNCALAILGDSITDGRCSTDNGNDRWPDLLFNRMLGHPYAQNIAILNQAAGGNRILKDGLGPNVLSRIDRDVFAQPGVRYIMVFQGVNDIGKAKPDTVSQKEMADRLIWGYKQIVSRAHAFGIPVFGATITPFCAPTETPIQPYSAPTRDHTRQRVNEWIKSSGSFDAVIDFDAVLRDTKNPAYLKPEYDSGDYLHPTLAAFQAMADAFPLEIFRQFSQAN